MSENTHSLMQSVFTSHLQEKAGISWASVTKMSKGENVSLDVLMKVCRFLHCDVGDIIEFVEDDMDAVIQGD